MHYQYFTGKPVDRAQKHQVGKHSKWFRGDVITVARHIVGDMPQSADPLPSRTRTFFSWLFDLFRPGLTNDVERLSDPVPGLIELRDLAVDLARIAKAQLGTRFPVLRTIKRRLAGATK
jgi:hypothetical protein